MIKRILFSSIGLLILSSLTIAGELDTKKMKVAIFNSCGGKGVKEALDSNPGFETTIIKKLIAKE